MERKIGEIFEYKGEWYQCVESDSCGECSLFTTECGSKVFGQCSKVRRTDNKHVIFKKLEKVGEPYTTFVNKTVQNYLLETAVSVPPKDVFTLINNEQRLIAIEIKQNKEDMSNTETLWYGPDKKEAKSLKLSNLKPFSLEAAKAGKPVCTRDGRKARIICFDRDWDMHIVALVTGSLGEEVHYYLSNGQVDFDKQNDDDLMMLPEKKEGWVNVYHWLNGISEYACDDIVFDTKECATQYAENENNYITTIKINWEE